MHFSLDLSLFLSAKRVESSGCERSFVFPSVDWALFSLLSSFPLSAGRIVVVRGRSLFHQWMESGLSLPKK